jgi:hypothetical protein
MEVKIFLTADYASVDRANKLNILGVFTQIHAHTLPSVVAQFYVILQLAFNDTEKGNRIVFIKLLNPSGTEIATVSAEFDIPDVGAGHTAHVNILTPLHNIVFSELGSYEFRLFIGEDYQASNQLEVKDFRALPNTNNEE